MTYIDSELENDGPVEIVDLTSYNMVDLSSSLCGCLPVMVSFSTTEQPFASPTESPLRTATLMMSQLISNLAAQWRLASLQADNWTCKNPEGDQLPRLLKVENLRIQTSATTLTVKNRRFPAPNDPCFRVNNEVNLRKSTHPFSQFYNLLFLN